MIIVATTSLPAVNRPNADRCQMASQENFKDFSHPSDQNPSWRGSQVDFLSCYHSEQVVIYMLKLPTTPLILFPLFVTQPN